jgi:WD40 repeat protein
MSFFSSRLELVTNLTGCIVLIICSPCVCHSESGSPADVGSKEAIINLGPCVDIHGDQLPDAAAVRLGTIRCRHEGEVSGVAVSPDGTLVASVGGSSRSVRVWDSNSGREVFRFANRITADAVAFSSDGKTLFTAGRDGLLQRWNVADGIRVGQTQEATLSGRRTPVFSADNKWVGIAGQDGSCGVWEVATGKRVCQLPTHKAEIVSLAFSANGKVLAIGGEDDLVRLYSVPAGAEMRRLHTQARWVYSLAFSPDNKTLATANAVSGLQLWDVESGEEVVREECGGCLCFSPNGKQLVAGAAGVLRVLDSGSGKELFQLEGHRSTSITALTFSSDGRLVSGGRDQTVLFWNLKTRKCLSAFPGHQGAVASLAVSPDGRSVATGGRDDGTLYVWDRQTGKVRHCFPGHEHDVLCIAFSPDGRIVATGDGLYQSGDKMLKKIRLWDLEKGKLVRTIDAHENGVYCLAFSPDGKQLLSGGGDDALRLWDANTGKALRFRPTGNLEGPFVTCAFSLDGRVVMGRNRLDWFVWDLKDGTPPFTSSSGHRNSFAGFLGDGKTFVSIEHRQDKPDGMTEELRVAFREMKTGKETRRVSLGGRFGSGCVVSPDGTTLATAEGSTIALSDLATGKPLCHFTGHRGGVTSLIFSPDSSLLISGSWDTTALVWDVAQAKRDALWSQLGAEKADDAGRVTAALAADPKGTLADFRQRIRRAAALEKRVRQLTAKCDDDRFEVREQATQELELLGGAAEFSLRLVLAEKPPVEVQKRIERLLDALDKSPPAAPALDPRFLSKEQAFEAAKRGHRRAPAPLWDGKTEARAWNRSFEVLVTIGGAEAEQVLATLAKEEPNLWFGQQAKTALEQLKARTKPRVDDP